MLLREMQIQNPTAIMIARTAVAQDDITGCVCCGGAARNLGLATADRQLCRPTAAFARAHCGREGDARRAALCRAVVGDNPPRLGGGMRRALCS